MENPEMFMKRAIDLSREALSQTGCAPFGAVIVRDGVIVGEGLNHARARFDPTSHGEVEAIRDACAKLKCVELKGCDLYTSCEPCALCVAAMQIVGIRKLYYAASLDQSDEALSKAPGHAAIDVGLLRQEAGARVHERRLPAEQMASAEAVAVLQAWAGSQSS